MTPMSAPRVPPGPGLAKPSIAWTWDYLLDGKDHFRADREQADRLVKLVPQAVALARESRAFTDRAVTWLAGMRRRCWRGIAALCGDIREPLAVLASAELRQVAGLRQPAGVVAGMILHFLPGDEARRACAQLTVALAPGSYLVASVGTGPAGAGRQAAAAYEAGTLHRHTAQDIAGFLGGLELVPPGIVHAEDWSPGAAVAAPSLDEACVLAAVGRVAGR